MATYEFVDLRIPEAALLADLVGIKWDFERARGFAGMFLKEQAARRPEVEAIEALSIAATVTYCRPFSSGVRYHLGEEDLKILSVQQRQDHDFLRNYRDKHIAHSVNEFEENIPRANYSTERVRDEGITSITYGSGRIMSLGNSDAKALIELATLFERKVDEQIERERERLLPIVRAMPLDEVLKGGRKAFDTRVADVAKRRTRAAPRHTGSRNRKPRD